MVKLKPIRLSLKLLFALTAIICVLLARYEYLKSKHNDLRSAGAILFFDWQNPSIAKTDMPYEGYSDAIEKPFSYVRRRYTTATTSRNWVEKLHDGLVSNEPIALQIDYNLLDEDLVVKIERMNHLKYLILKDAVSCFEPDLQKTMVRLERALPNADLHTEWEQLKDEN